MTIRKPKTRLDQFLRDHPNIKRSYLAAAVGRSPGWLTRVANGSRRILLDDMAEIRRELSLIVGREVRFEEIMGEPLTKRRRKALV